MEIKNYKRDVIFNCDNLTLWEGLLLKSVVDAINKGKKIIIESDEDFEKNGRLNDSL
jgi:hypothetical protein